MINLLRKIANTRLLRALMVGAYGQGIQLGLQLLGVPIMIAAWGLGKYGVWLALYSVPSYLIIADFGLTTAAANDMAINMARGDREAARRVFHALRLLVWTVTGVLFLITALAIYGFGASWLSFAEAATHNHARATLMMLVTYGLIGLSNGTVNAGFRAVDRYALGSALYQSIFLLECFLLLLVVRFGAGLYEAAIVIISIRIAGSVLANAALSYHSSWLKAGRQSVHLGELRRLLRPAMGSMVLPFANATAMQGPVALLTSALGAATVPIYTTVRTLTRFPLQIAMVASVATVPRITVADASGDKTHKARLILINFVMTILILVPASLGLVLLGRWLIHAWTRGAVVMPLPLLWLMTAAMVANGIWTMLSNFLVALNKQEKFAYVYGLGAIAALAVGRLLIPELGVTGMAAGMLLLDIAMLVWLSILVLRLQILEVAELRLLVIDGLAYLRRRRHVEDSR